jgi:hypothetical protein
MASKKTETQKGLIGRRVEELGLAERIQYANQFVAFRLYSPPVKVQRDGMEFVDVRERRVEAAGKSIQECEAQLRRRNLNPTEFEFTILKPPY